MTAGLPAGALSDPRAPWRQEYYDAAQARAIDRRADELAADGFDESDPWALEWLNDERDAEDYQAILREAVRWNAKPGEGAYDLMCAIDKLRERYVQQMAHMYRDGGIEQLRDEGVL